MISDEIRNSTILIVDDNPTNLDVLFNYLNDFGFKVLLAHDGESALDLVIKEKPDLILLEILMPGMGGFEVCRKLKNIGETLDIPIVFISALSDTSNKIKGFELGGVDYITKPFQQDEVLARVIAHLTIRNQQKSLREASASKDRLFSIISHDLRGAFGNILGLSQFLAESNNDLTKKEIEEIAGKCHNAIKITFALLENLLHWSRLQTGRVVFQPDILDLEYIVKKVFDLFGQNAQNKNIKLQTNIDNSFKAFADENMAFTVLRNLIHNAIKFTKAEGIISVEAAEKGEMIEISVKDSGVGIPQDVLINLFNLENPNSAKGTAEEKGTGLGLILCKELIEKNGGQIWIESKVTIGTKVFFTIPKAI